MLNFEKLTINDIQIIKPYFMYATSRTCDNTVGGTVMWRDFFMAEYAQHKRTLVFKVKLKYHDDVVAFTFPVGKDTYRCIREIEYYCKQCGIPLIFCTVTEKETDIIKGIYADVKTFSNPDWSDYLYRKEDLVSLPGRRYSGQRNHINYFKKTYSDYRFVEIDADNLHEVMTFYKSSVSSVDKHTKIFFEEKTKTIELLDNYDVYGLLGGALYIGSEIVAFAIGEIVNDTLFVHVERANYSYRGAYQVIMNLFAMHFSKPDILYINREEDVGDEGLRNAKKALHPIDIIKKYTVIINDK